MNIKRRSFIKSATLGSARFGLAASVAANIALPRGAVAQPANRARSATSVKTILSFASEAAHATDDYDFIKAIAEFLTEEKLVGNFHLTGDYARALKRLGRRDVVEALQRHEIGFHCNHHGAMPFMAGYLEKYSWEEGMARWLSQETEGIAMVAELMKRRPVYYTTEFSKAPQTIYGSTLLGVGTIGFAAIPMREHSAVWYCNGFVPSVENIVGLESFHAPGDREKDARERLDDGVAKQQSNAKDVLRVFLHSYKYYMVPPYGGLARKIYKDDKFYYEDYPDDAPRQPPERFRQLFEMFKRTIRYHARKSEFVSFSEYRNGFEENAGIWIDLADIDRLGRFLDQSVDAYVTDIYSISPAEAFGVLARVLRVWSERGQFPSNVFVRTLIGPRTPVPEGPRPDTMVAVGELWKVIQLIDRDLEIAGALPGTVSVGGISVGPGQLLRGLVKVYAGLRERRSVDRVAFSGRDLPEIANEPYFKESGFSRPGIYPDGFNGQNICAMSRAQSWSWKPALKRRA